MIRRLRPEATTLVDERHGRYLTESDPLLAEALYDHYRTDGGEVPITESEWFRTVQQIKADIPLE